MLNLLFLAEEERPTLSWGGFFDMVINWCKTTGIRLLIAILIMLITFALVNALAKKIYKTLEKKHADVTISRVIYNSIKVVLKCLILVVLIGYVGVETASISAMIATLGVGISLAVQGTLANFVGGIIIILMRPFRIGDFITTNNQSGTVEEIKLFYTHIVTVDNKVIFIPNGSVANNVIVNVSLKKDRRCDVTFGVAYKTDLELAKNLILKVCAANEKIYTKPATFVDVTEYGASSINIVCRAWCKSEDYWDVHFYLLNEIKNEFDKNGIEIPFNQMDVHFDKEEISTVKTK